MTGATGTEECNMMPPQPSMDEILEKQAWEDFQEKLGNADTKEINKVIDVIGLQILNLSGGTNDKKSNEYILDKNIVSKFYLSSHVFQYIVETSISENKENDPKFALNLMCDTIRYLKRIKGDRPAMQIYYPGEERAWEMMKRMKRKPESFKSFFRRLGYYSLAEKTL